MRARFDDDDGADYSKRNNSLDHRNRRNRRTKDIENNEEALVRFEPIKPAHFEPTPTISVRPSSNSRNSFSAPSSPLPSSVQTEQVTIKWFNSERGFGFVTDTNNKDLFFHISVLKKVGIMTPEIGQVLNIVRGPNRAKPGDMVVSVFT